VEQRKNFIVYGSGRTGSHWVESILIGLLAPTSFRYANCSLLPGGWIYHTNNIEELLAIHQEIKDSVTLVVCDRSNYFDAAISYYVAKRTGEFFVYTDAPVAPFNVDPEDFATLLHGLHVTYRLVDSEVRPRYNSVVRIDYNSLVAAAVPEKYVADQLGIDYTENSEYTNQSIKNTRNYKELVLNWDQLVDIYQNYTVDQ
jgi:LPS sulfotransferase NodH